MRKFEGINRLRDIEMMTLTEFLYKRYAQEYKEVDKLYDMHLSALIDRKANEKKEVGSGKNKHEQYVYGTMEDFFDYEEAIKQIDGQHEEPKKKEQPKKQLSPAEIAMKRNT